MFRHLGALSDLGEGCGCAHVHATTLDFNPAQLGDAQNIHYSFMAAACGVIDHHQIGATRDRYGALLRIG